jgi:sugar (pentulose or hexulose) kinase
MAERDTGRSVTSEGNAVLGIELGSTRIKAVLVGPKGEPLASGAHGWQNSQVDGIWTYSLDEVWSGIAACYADLARDVGDRYGVTLNRVAAAGVSAMMHGYLAFDSSGELLVPFRTWRNNITGDASAELTALFDYPIPQRWSIAHLHHAVLAGEEHVGRIGFLTTLAGYVHWKLTGRQVVGIGEASGMFPVDASTGQFDERRLEKYDALPQVASQPWTLSDLLPEISPVGESAGNLTEEGARLLDPGGTLESGVPFCPPEGDAETGMVATNSVRPRTGNVSAGTSVFAMIVLEKEPSRAYEEIDLVMTPDGNLVGMAHSNNCTSDYDAWVSIIGEAAQALGAEVDDGKLYSTLLPLALSGDPDAGGLLAYGYVSGEHITGFSEGRPLFVRSPDASFTLANFMRAHLFSALCALRTGLNVLFDEGVTVQEIRGHGGFFKTNGVGQRLMAAATGTPISLPESAGEGGAWGMAVLAAYSVRPERSESLADYLDRLLAGRVGEAVAPDLDDVAGFQEYFKRYHQGLAIESAAVNSLKQRQEK